MGDFRKMKPAKKDKPKSDFIKVKSISGTDVVINKKHIAAVFIHDGGKRVVALSGVGKSQESEFVGTLDEVEKELL